jgi:hypothetical protein
MSRVDDLLGAALKGLPTKPPDDAKQSAKQPYSTKVSNVVALALAEELRQRGLKESRPAPPGLLDRSGAERRLAGGIGAKKVDVTWATEESGLLLAISVKSINFRDQVTHNFQKNLTNRRGDMLFEAVTLHRRFPYAVLGGIIFLDKEAANDQTLRRRSTFENAHVLLRLFTGRDDPAGRDEQFEHLYIALLDANPFSPEWSVFEAGSLDPISMDEALDRLLSRVVERNSDFYELFEDKLRRM